MAIAPTNYNADDRDEQTQSEVGESLGNSTQRGNNRYTNVASSEENLREFNRDRMLLNIMRSEYPEDRLYSRGQLTPGNASQQSRESFTDDNQEFDKELAIAKRNNQNIAQFHADKELYEKYELTKSYPTIDEDELDELIDEEWEEFQDPDEPEEEAPIPAPVGVSGLFMVNQKVEREDFHHLYIMGGPQTLSEEEPDLKDVFCVFYIHNGLARPIPNYKTLEVMLVEKGHKYDIITEASPDEIQKYDLLLDGQDTREDYADEEEDDDPTDETSGYTEYLERAMADRTQEWNNEIRFRSGYRPKHPFLRDPGDYIKPATLRATGGRQPLDDDGNPLPPDLLAKYDPEDMYTDMVFLKQTYREQIREKFEGRMVIARWPQPYEDPDNPDNPDAQSDQDVRRNTPSLVDDWTNTTRMMIFGHWKQVRSKPSLRLYATLNNVDMGAYEPQEALMGLTLEEAFEAGEGRYGGAGLINLLVEGGGISVLEHEDDDPHPIWVTFPHIVDADTDGIPGLNLDEYIEYLDYWSNGGNMFDVPHMAPFEPPGSIHYYDQSQYRDYTEQALMQEQIDAIKDQIAEMFPPLTATVEQMKIAFDSLPVEYIPYADRLLGSGGPLYKIMLSKQGKWKYVKRKGRKKKKKTKTKVSEKNLFKMIKKAGRFRTRLKEKDEKQIVKKTKWMRTVARDKFASWANAGGGFDVNNFPIDGPLAPAVEEARAAADNAFTSFNLTPVLLTTTFAATLALASPVAFAVGILFAAIDALVGEVPDGKYDLPPWRFMKDNWYVKACIYRELEEEVSDLYSRSAQADVYMPWLREVINRLYDQMFEIDEQIVRASSIEDFQNALNGLRAMQELFRILNEGGLLDYVHGLRKDIDGFVVDHLKRQYDAVQFIRKKCHKKVGKKKKFAVLWPKGPQKILNEYISGLKYDNYLPF